MVGKRIFFFNVTVRTVFNSCNDYTWLYNIYYIYNIINIFNFKKCSPSSLTH